MITTSKYIILLYIYVFSIYRLILNSWVGPYLIREISIFIFYRGPITHPSFQDFVTTCTIPYRLVPKQRRLFQLVHVGVGMNAGHAGPRTRPLLDILTLGYPAATFNPEGNTVPNDWCMTVGVTGDGTNGFDAPQSDGDWPNGAYNQPAYVMVWLK